MTTVGRNRLEGESAWTERPVGRLWEYCDLQDKDGEKWKLIDRCEILWNKAKW